MKQTLILTFTCILLSQSAFAQGLKEILENRTPHTTAISLYLKKDKKADIRTPEAIAEITQIENELNVLFDMALTEEGKKAIPLPLPWEPGVVLTSPKGEVLNILNELMAPLPEIKRGPYLKEKSLDVATQCPDENSICGALKALEIHKVKGEGFSSKFDTWYFYFDTEMNPHTKAAEILSQYENDFDWVQANNLMTMGGSRKPPIARKISEKSVEYTFAMGGGDCPAGCTVNLSRTYSVSKNEKGELQASFMSREGVSDDSTDRDARELIKREKAFFKN